MQTAVNDLFADKFGGCLVSSGNVLLVATPGNEKEFGSMGLVIREMYFLL